MTKLAKEVLSARRLAWALVVAKLFVVERSTRGAVGSTGTKYTLITFVFAVAVVPLSVNSVASVYFGIRYNCFFTTNEVPFAFLTTLVKGIAFALFAAEILSFPRVVPTIFLLLISVRLFSTSLFVVLSTFPPPAYDDGFTKSNTLTPAPFLLKYPVDAFLLKPLEFVSPNALSFPVTVVKDGWPWLFFGVAVIVFKTSFTSKPTPLVASNL